MDMTGTLDYLYVEATYMKYMVLGIILAEVFILFYFILFGQKTEKNDNRRRGG